MVICGMLLHGAKQEKAKENGGQVCVLSQLAKTKAKRLVEETKTAPGLKPYKTELES